MMGSVPEECTLVLLAILAYHHLTPSGAVADAGASELARAEAPKKLRLGQGRVVEDAPPEVENIG
jgi:hypothetical protein